MKTFLHFVAKDIIEKYGTDLSRIAVVFPNKRAALFLNEELARCAGKPLWAPTYLTISELFRQYSRLSVGDPIKLVCELYKSYTQITQKEETLDHFYDWGKLLISDFDDVDKNMADAQQVFSNIANIRELDDVSYLTEEQKEVLKSFFGNFSEEHNSRLKELFILLWKQLGNIYKDFRQRLSAQGIAYEGMLYRDVIDNDRIKTEYDKYIFVGFNVLQKVEQNLFGHLKSEGVAEFYWDYDNFYVQSAGEPTGKEAGKYIRQYLEIFGDSLSYGRKEACNNFCRKKDISFMKAKTENIQARYVAEWLRQNERYKDGKRTAIIMCDETILQSVIHCIPAGDKSLGDEIRNINITTGFPLTQTPVASFVAQLFELRVAGIRADGSYRISCIRKLLSHPLACYISKQSGSLLRSLAGQHILFPTRAELAIDEGLTLLFGDTTEDNAAILRWINCILKTIASKDDNILYQESVFSIYTIINRLAGLVESSELEVDSITMQRLVRQLISSASIPFHGEPAIGIQIMGVLETRNLDFDHVLLLSCNEGNMPKGIRDSSFIPYSIRKAYGLTTVDNKVAIYSYYFYRMLQRATDVTVLYNASTENGSQGEMSRFMLQMMVESGHNINMFSLTAGNEVEPIKIETIAKNEEIMRKMLSFGKLSPTAINKYLRCQLQFYYAYIVGLKEPDDNMEDGVTNRTFGTIFHDSLEEIYKEFSGSGKEISAELVDTLSERSNVERIVDRMFKKQFFGNDETHWRRLDYNGIHLINREVIIKYVQRLLAIDRQLAPFRILAVEDDVLENFCIHTAGGTKNILIGGRIDRMDIVTDRNTGKQRIRVIDYKTGSKAISSPITEVSEIFAPLLSKIESYKHPDYYLQSMLYSTIVSRSGKFNPQGIAVSPALIFIQRAFCDDYDSTIKIGKEAVTDISAFDNEYREQLGKLLGEMFDSSKPFSPTPDEELCKYCPYKALCNRQ